MTTFEQRELIRRNAETAAGMCCHAVRDRDYRSADRWAAAEGVLWRVWKDAYDEHRGIAA